MLKQLVYRTINHLPGALRLPVQYLPFELYRAPLETLLSRLMAEQLNEGELDFLEQHWLQIEVIDLGLTFAISVDDDKLVVAQAKEKPDVLFAGNSQDLLLVAARKQDPDTLFFRRKLTISGNTELGLAVKNLMDAIDWEQLPRLITFALEHSAKWVEEAQSYEQTKGTTSLQAS